MTGHTSQNALPRESRLADGQLRRCLISLLTSVVFLATVLAAVDRIPKTDLGRSISAQLSQLADPQSWTP